MPHRMPARLEGALDVVIAVAMTLFLAGIAVGTSATGDGPHGISHDVVVPLLFAFSQGIPLIWRRRAPLLVLAIVVAGALALWLAEGTRTPPFAVMVALYTCATTLQRRESLVALAVAALCGVPYVADLRFGDKLPFELVRLGFEAAVVIAAWLAGELVRARRAYMTELEDRAANAEARARAAEQARIARELHDVIAHNVSVMVVQAAAADDVFDASPDKARAALRSIEASGREALAELRRLLGSGDAQRAPQPGLARLDELVERVRGAGLAVEVALEGEPRPLAAGVDLSAYRIVQEALTNTLRHARAARARVCVAFDDSQLRLEVTDDGVGSAATGTGGRGLVGMRERAAVLGGRLEAGPRVGGGFGVEAVLPL